MPACRPDPPAHRTDDLIRLFDAAFAGARTVLVPNADWPPGDSKAAEPVYLPADARCPWHRIVFAHGFYASALHEIAHWCIAGKRRREMIDYGYWYKPDDRNAREQVEFARVEVKPQAIEMAFSAAARFPFRVSLDNLSGSEIDRAPFERRVREQCTRYRRQGFPPRAAQFIRVLADFYGG